jgi:hypothetical protein
MKSKVIRIVKNWKTLPKNSYYWNSLRAIPAVYFID